MRCATLRSTGLGDVPGAYAEYVLAGSHETFRLPDSVSDREGALVEPLAVGLHAVSEAKLLAGENVLIVGAGPVGLSAALWARHLGAREVIASDLVPSRLELAGRNGATGAINPGKEEVMPAFERLAGGPPDVIFECVGLPGLIQQCLDMAPPCSRIIVAGVCVQPDTIVPFVANLKELWLKFVTGYRKQDFGISLDMLRAERLTAGSMITDVVDLPGLPDAFEALKRPTTQCKVIVEP
jgi:(R,R)-butanediol dehydrogenase/meso-butanediol dehydrogenase/diacetyl reductase